MKQQTIKDVSFSTIKSSQLNGEWLETNGIGGYASSTIACCHTRKYHGLLVSRLTEPPGKYVLLSKVDDSIITKDNVFPLSAHRYNDALVPPNGLNLTHFSQEKCPTFKYQFKSVNVQKELVLLNGENTVLTRYTCTKNQAGGSLVIKPLIAFRDFHGLTRENIFLRVRTFPVKNGFVLSPYDGLPAIYIQTTGKFEFYPSPCWYRNFQYTQEIERGFDANEDLFCPGQFEIEFPKNSNVIFSASLMEQNNLEEAWEREMASRRANAKKVRGTPLQKALKKTASQFISKNASGQTAIIAGFPWFLEWGRDAMIALPGLLLSDSNQDAYLKVLEGFAAHQKNGIIPNFLGDTPAANAYNSADASLWFGFAVQYYLTRANGRKTISKTTLNALSNIFNWYKNGTDYHIKMLENGLLSVGSPLHQLTWMDATVDGRPVTPRHGCPVEINALWYNFMAFIAAQGKKMGLSEATEAAQLLPTIKESFNAKFWIEEEKYLADVVNGDQTDRSVRCNQIFAVSLPYSPLDDEQAKHVVDKVTAELLTSVGLRTLSPRDANFRPFYAGPPNQRDAAYHNGTVWPWLLGHYGDALIKVSDDKAAALDALEDHLAAFENHLQNGGVNSISEVFDGGEPSTGKGCISQAWSVAEILRLSQEVQSARAALEQEQVQCVS